MGLSAEPESKDPFPFCKTSVCTPTSLTLRLTWLKKYRKLNNQAEQLRLAKKSEPRLKNKLSVFTPGVQEVGGVQDQAATSSLRVRLLTKES